MKLEEYLKTREGANNGNPLFSDSLCVKDIDDDERTVTAIISTDRIDRMKEVLMPRGAKIVEYLRNPVVPWGHNSQEPPVGKAKWIRKQKSGLVAQVEFAVTERAEEIWQLFKQGFLRAFSVGFRPLKGHSPTPDEIKKKPEWAEANYIYDEWELLEFSPVTIPANPDALAIAIKSHEIVLSDEIRKELDVIEEDEETFYPPEVVTEVVRVVAEKIDKEIMDETGEMKAEKYKCECIECGHKLETEKHCKDIKCSECGGTMRREERPGPGQESLQDSVQEVAEKLGLIEPHEESGGPEIEKEKPVEDVKPFKTEDKHVRALPLPMMVNPDPHISLVVEDARGIEDAFPLRVTHNYDAAPFVEKVEPIIEVEEIFKVEPLINVTPFETEQQKQELVTAALDEFDKDVRGVMWEVE